MITCNLDFFMQVSVCNPDELKCIENIKVDNSKCLKKCSGLHVASFEKIVLSDENSVLTELFEYLKRKDPWSFPEKLKGNNDRM